MRTQKEVFNKLFKEDKTELSAQKIELGLADDLRSEFAKFEKTYNDLGEYTRTILNARGGLSKAVSKVENERKVVQKMIVEFEKKLKDLGIDSEPSILKNVKNKVSELMREVKRLEKDFL